MEKLTEQILHDVIRPRPANSFKGSYGKVTLIGATVTLAVLLSWLLLPLSAPVLV